MFGLEYEQNENRERILGVFMLRSKERDFEGEAIRYQISKRFTPESLIRLMVKSSRKFGVKEGTDEVRRNIRSVLGLSEPDQDGQYD